MKTLLVKSLDPEITTEEVQNPGIIRFTSFRTIVQNLMADVDTDDELIGFRVTDQGIELVFQVIEYEEDGQETCIG
jgi:hypothetical protein